MVTSSPYGLLDKKNISAPRIYSIFLCMTTICGTALLGSTISLLALNDPNIYLSVASTYIATLICSITIMIENFYSISSLEDTRKLLINAHKETSPPVFKEEIEKSLSLEHKEIFYTDPHIKDKINIPFTCQREIFPPLSREEIQAKKSQFLEKNMPFCPIRHIEKMDPIDIEKTYRIPKDTLRYIGGNMICTTLLLLDNTINTATFLLAIKDYTFELARLSAYTAEYKYKQSMIRQEREILRHKLRKFLIKKDKSEEQIITLQEKFIPTAEEKSLCLKVLAKQYFMKQYLLKRNRALNLIEEDILYNTKKHIGADRFIQRTHQHIEYIIEEKMKNFTHMLRMISSKTIEKIINKEREQNQCKTLEQEEELNQKKLKMEKCAKEYSTQRAILQRKMYEEELKLRILSDTEINNIIHQQTYDAELPIPKPFYSHISSSPGLIFYVLRHTLFTFYHKVNT